MKIKVQSGAEISDDTIKSKEFSPLCPNESLYHTFDDFTPR